MFKRILCAILSLSILCLSGCSSVENITFEELMEEVNAKHQAVEQVTYNTSQYVNLVDEDIRNQYYTLENNGEYHSKKELTQQQAMEDITFLFDAFYDFYGPYEYFGGDEVFHVVESEIKSELQKQDMWKAEDVEAILLEHLKFMRDGHFTINMKELNPKKIPFFFRECIFLKTEDGYQTKEGKKVEYVEGYENLDELMKRSISQEGELVYYPVLLEDGDVWTALESPQICKETLKIHYTNGDNQELKAEPYQIYVDSDLKQPDGEVVSSRKHGEIPVFQFNTFSNSYEKEILAGAKELKEASISILDLRSNPGGHGQIAIDWMDEYAGSKDLGNTVTIHTKTGMKDYPMEEWIQNNDILIIMVGKYSASASEAFLDYANDVENVLIVGENTRGAMLTEAYNILLPNSRCRVSIGGNTINLLDKEYFEELRGFCPDIWVPAGEAEKLIVKYLEKNVD